MPCSPVKARHLLRDGKAVVLDRHPFTIQLTSGTGETIQDINFGVDTGFMHVGLSASTKKAELFSSEVTLRTDMSKLIAERAMNRRTRRSLKTRYRPARHDNRVHTNHKGWIPPSFVHQIDAHLALIDKICRLLPVKKIILETAAFDIQKLDNPDIEGEEYRQGPQMGFRNVREYVLWRDDHTCQHCKGKSKDPVLQVHHLESRLTGGNAPNNLITLCRTCHEAFHEGKIKLKAQRGQSRRAENFMTVIRPRLVELVRERYPDKEVETTFGYITKFKRESLGLPKSHHADAFCIAGNLNAQPLPDCLVQRQMRRHNRQIHQKTIGKGGVRKRAQAPHEVLGFRLFDKVWCKGQIGFIYGRRLRGWFLVKDIHNKTIADITHRKLKLIEPRRGFISVWCLKEDLG